jgi:hypothetical protein
VQHGEETNLRSEVFRIAANSEKRFRSRPEEDAVDRLFVVERDAGEFFRNGEDNVEILK